MALSFSSLPFPSISKPKPKPFLSSRLRAAAISSDISGAGDISGDDSSEKQKQKQKQRDQALALLHLAATLTIVPSAAAAAAAAGPKRASSVSPEELRRWSAADLPSISDRVPYTDIPRLHAAGELRCLVKVPSAALRRRAEPVLVILHDSRVLRTTLPAADRDPGFWSEWDRLRLDAACVNAYTPPARPPAPAPARPWLQWLARAPERLSELTRPRTKQKPKRVVELERARRELAERTRMEIERVRREQEAVERAMRAKRKAEERKRKLEIRKAKAEESLQRAREDYVGMDELWFRLSKDKNFSTVLGLFFFYVFYQTVVLSYRKSQKDYDDRIKIQKAEAEERKKMRQLERELAGLEGPGDDDDEEKAGEQNPYLKMAQQFMRSGARVRRAHGKRPPQYLEKDVDVKFSDVAGLGKIRLELEEVVKFFTLGEMYRKRGVKIPGGILLCGPPGVGKTLLAKAVAGEAGVNFFSISASQFVEIYVGVGASRVRALYQEAKEMAPSVVFIDELDAVGRERGLIKGSGGQERDATLNQLLVCLDGFEGRGEVITIAATNRPDILDPALVRPGRFDRKIYIPKPSLIGRVEILKVHAQKKPMAEDVDYLAVASATAGMVGAELANILEIAAINMMRDGRSEITTDDLLQAAQIEERGALDKKDISLDMWKQVAFNEAAMAVVAVNFPELRRIEFITIAPRAGTELGYVRVKMDYLRFELGMLSRQDLLDYITVQLAPRAADEIWHGENQMSTIWAETADNARTAARRFVLGGLSEKNYGISDYWVADRVNDIDLEAMRILNNCYGRAKEILQRNQSLLDAIVDHLVEKKNLTKNEFFKLVEEYGHLEPIRQNIVDIRNTRCLEFQEMMMAHKKSA